MVTLISASPIALAVIKPLLFTVATVVLLLLNVADSVAYAGTYAVTLMVFVPPAFSVTSVSDSVKSVTVGLVIVRVALALTLGTRTDVAVTVTVPLTRLAVSTPAALTSP